LTGSKKPGELCRATLLPATRFIHYVESHPFYAQMTRLSPANLTMVLDFMKYEYNQTRTVLPLEPSLPLEYPLFRRSMQSLNISLITVLSYKLGKTEFIPKIYLILSMILAG
jgi:hypothetical protein